MLFLRYKCRQSDRGGYIMLLNIINEKGKCVEIEPLGLPVRDLHEGFQELKEILEGKSQLRVIDNKKLKFDKQYDIKEEKYREIEWRSEVEENEN